MPNDSSGAQPLPQVHDRDADDIAAFIMARAFADIYRDVNAGPLPKALASILRQVKQLRDQV